MRLGRPRAEWRARTVMGPAGRVLAARGRLAHYETFTPLPTGRGPFLVAYARECGTDGYDNRSSRKARARKERGC